MNRPKIVLKIDSYMPAAEFLWLIAFLFVFPLSSSEERRLQKPSQELKR
jgi:hypothetical protein